MWKTIAFYKDGSPKLDLNNQGVIYSYGQKRVIPPKKSRANNPYYRISVDGQNEYIHILVAKNFPEICGEWYDGCEIHHKDFNPKNNDANNLVVVSPEEHISLHKALKTAKEKPSTFNEKIEWYEKQGELSNKHYYCRKSKLNKKGLAPIELSFTLNGKRYFLNTGEYADPNAF